ncbi:vacuolar protein-sorting-associated protein 11 homolog [Selaginella moellendorffii]|uniref:vacuolar protein-sorting-associated protein 11 homolog n=1 Tax=Selaginella moellendorffii TaxID=88036 RepID=UPI000D1CA2A6|nr:vacuolar protein-sorting-associated protein 11 homolog [Selaginella moellendorffii]|eukprot:XP_024520888.1 vacuolar protein-sorting-associated protein 11 homolog [Selaginella moellendorffii]
MYQWRKFPFFEEKALGSGAAAELGENIVCSSSGRGQIVLGGDDAMVHVLDRGFKLSYSFQAHSTSVLHVHQLKQRNMLVTVGEDEAASAQVSSMSLKLWDLSKHQSEGPSSSRIDPVCDRALRIFSNKFPEAKITCFLVYEEAPPILLLCFGLESGIVYCIRGDIARERISRLKLSVDPATATSSASPITGLGLRLDGQALQLFVVTAATVNLYNMLQHPPQKQVLDGHGCDGLCVAMSDRQELVIGRPEAIYFYEVDGRGPCWAFEGEKKYVGWFRGYLLAVIADVRKSVFNIYDLKSKLIAYSSEVEDVAQVFCEWGIIAIITKDHKVTCLTEKDMNSKLELLYRKNLYPVAISLVQRQQADAAATAQVMRKYGDHLYSKQDYDEAMAQYIKTIGQLEPSYVIQKFLDAQLIQNLTLYLERLHEKALASADHTTLLLNCYTKLKDATKLDKFIRGDEQTEGQLRFDVETAVRVCRAAGYYEQALYVAKTAGLHESYLKILLGDLGNYVEALEYISGLSPSEAEVTLKQYGKILVEHKPDETTATLLTLCSSDGNATHTSSSSAAPPSPMEFVHIYVDQPRWLIVLLEQYLVKVSNSPIVKDIHNTLLELYLSDSLASTSPEEESSSSSRKTQVKKTRSFKDAVSNTRETAEERSLRLQKSLDLLKKGWGAHEEEPQYDEALAVMLCERHKFRDGLLFLYEKKRLFKEVMSCYMKDSDYRGLISCCERLADTSRGGDPSLWADVLAYFGERGEDCSKEVKEVLGYIEQYSLLPPLVVLQTLSKNPTLTLSVVKNYIATQLKQESRQIEDDRKTIQKYDEDNRLMRAEIEELRTKPRVFQLSKCTACTSILDLPAVHFFCMHSFHQRCLGDNEKECPVCAPSNHTLLEMKRNLAQNATDHDRFFQLVRNSDDGFSVIADYFGRGMLSTHRP